MCVSGHFGTGANLGGSVGKDKTYNITILHTNDHHGHFWQNANGEYGLAAQRRWWIRFAMKWLCRAVAFYCFPAVTLIPVFLNLIYRMPSLISVA